MVRLLHIGGRLDTNPSYEKRVSCEPASIPTGAFLTFTFKKAAIKRLMAGKKKKHGEPAICTRPNFFPRNDPLHRNFIKAGSRPKGRRGKGGGQASIQLRGSTPSPRGVGCHLPLNAPQCSSIEGVEQTH